MSILEPKQFGKNNSEINLGRREFLKSIYSFLFASSFVSVFSNLQNAKSEIVDEKITLITDIFSSETIQKIQTLIQIYQENGKLDRIDIIRSKNRQKLVLSFVAKINNLLIRSKYKNEEIKKFDNLKKELEIYLFAKMEKIESFITTLDGISIEFVNLK